MTLQELRNLLVKVKVTGIPILHQHPENDWAFKFILGERKTKSMERT